MRAVWQGHKSFNNPHPRYLNTGLPAYSDTGYSDIPATVTLFGSKKGSPYTENPGYSDIPATVTLFGRPNTVTVSGEACTESQEQCQTSDILKDM